MKLVLSLAIEVTKFYVYFLCLGFAILFRFIPIVTKGSFDVICCYIFNTNLTNCWRGRIIQKKIRFGALYC